MAYSNLDVNCQHLAKNGVEITPSAAQLNLAASFLVQVPVEDLNAGASIADRVVFIAPHNLTIDSIKLIPQGDSSGIDEDDTCVVTIKYGNTKVAESTFDDTTFPVDGGVATMAVLSGAIASGGMLKLSVTNDTAANPPAFLIQISGTFTS